MYWWYLCNDFHIRTCLNVLNSFITKLFGHLIITAPCTSVFWLSRTSLKKLFFFTLAMILNGVNTRFVLYTSHNQRYKARKRSTLQLTTLCSSFSCSSFLSPSHVLFSNFQIIIVYFTNLCFYIIMFLFQNQYLKCFLVLCFKEKFKFNKKN